MDLAGWTHWICILVSFIIRFLVNDFWVTGIKLDKKWAKVFIIVKVTTTALVYLQWMNKFAFRAAPTLLQVSWNKLLLFIATRILVLFLKMAGSLSSFLRLPIWNVDFKTHVHLDFFELFKYQLLQCFIHFNILVNKWVFVLASPTIWLVQEYKALTFATFKDVDIIFG